MFSSEKSELDLLCDISSNFLNPDALLLHRITVTNGYAAILLGLEIDGYAVRRTDLVLTAVALTDRACIVKINRELLSQLLPDRHSLVGQLLGQRQYSSLNGARAGCRRRNGTTSSLPFLVLTYDFLVVSVAQEGQCNTVSTKQSSITYGIYFSFAS